MLGKFLAMLKQGDKNYTDGNEYENFVWVT